MSHPKENQCKHTFEITYKACRACSGWNTACRRFETQSLQEEEIRQNKNDNPNNFEKWRRIRNQV